ncbi:MAG: hypothetical protein ACI37Z_10415 [Candidatus Gastranaerophilaceae bacterium]
MKKHPWLCFFAILLVAGLVVGLSAADLWQYIIDFTKIGIDLVVSWLKEVVVALRDSFTGVTSGTSTEVTTTENMLDLSTANCILGLFNFSL